MKKLKKKGKFLRIAVGISVVFSIVILALGLSFLFKKKSPKDMTQRPGIFTRILMPIIPSPTTLPSTPSPAIPTQAQEQKMENIEELTGLKAEVARLEEKIRILEEIKAAQKPEEVEKPETEIEKLWEQIRLLQTEAKIQSQKDLEKINAEIAELKEKIEAFEPAEKPEIPKYESMYQPEEPEEEYEEANYEPRPIRTCWVVSPWFWADLYSYSSWYYRSCYPYLYCCLGWHPWTSAIYYAYYPYYNYYGYYYSSRYGYGTDSFYRGSPIVRKDQLRSHRPNLTPTKSNIKTYPSTGTLRTSSVPKVSKDDGRFESPWGHLGTLKKSIASGSSRGVYSNHRSSSPSGSFRSSNSFRSSSRSSSSVRSAPSRSSSSGSIRKK